MTSINKKKIALIEKHNQEKLRNLAMKSGVILKSPETVFLSNDTKFGKNVNIGAGTITCNYDGKKKIKLRYQMVLL